MSKPKQRGELAMMRTLQFGAARGVGILVAAVVALGGAATAGATAPSSVTIQETAVFAGDHQPPIGTFAASGIPGCATGSFSDHLVSFIPSGTRPVVDRMYVCASGDTLTARLALHLGTIDAAGTQTVEGTWRIISGTGALSDLSGSGSTSGLNSGCAPVGTAFGMCATGVDTVTAAVH